MKNDGRKLNTHQQTNLRKYAVQLVIDGESPANVTELLGLGEKTIYRWLRDIRNNGYKSLEPKKRTGRNRALSEERSREIIYCLLYKNPEYFGIDSVFWTRAIISKLICDKYDVSIGLNSVTHLLERYGVYPQQEIKKICNDTNDDIQEWLRCEYSKIKLFARKCNALVLWMGYKAVSLRGEDQFIDMQNKYNEYNLIESSYFISLTQHKGGFLFKSFVDPVSRSSLISMFESISILIKRPVYIIAYNDEILSLSQHCRPIYKAKKSVYIFILPSNDGG